VSVSVFVSVSVWICVDVVFMYVLFSSVPVPICVRADEQNKTKQYDEFSTPQRPLVVRRRRILCVAQQQQNIASITTKHCNVNSIHELYMNTSLCSTYRSAHQSCAADRSSASLCSRACRV
jgi:hypothetical protein